MALWKWRRDALLSLASVCGLITFALLFLLANSMPRVLQLEIDRDFYPAFNQRITSARRRKPPSCDRFCSRAVQCFAPGALIHFDRLGFPLFIDEHPEK